MFVRGARGDIFTQGSGVMAQGKAGMGMSKHRKAGHTTKSPKFRFLQKREAERDVRLDRSRIREPKGSVSEVFRKQS